MSWENPGAKPESWDERILVELQLINWALRHPDTIAAEKAEKFQNFALGKADGTIGTVSELIAENTRLRQELDKIPTPLGWSADAVRELIRENAKFKAELMSYDQLKLVLKQIGATQ